MNQAPKFRRLPVCGASAAEWDLRTSSQVQLQSADLGRLSCLTTRGEPAARRIDAKRREFAGRTERREQKPPLRVGREYAVIYNSTAASGNLIGWWDYGSALSTNNGDTFTVNLTGNALELVRVELADQVPLGVELLMLIEQRDVVEGWAIKPRPICG